MIKLSKKILTKLGLSSAFMIDRGSYKLRAYPSSLSSALWNDPYCRYDTERFFQSYLRAGDTVVDIGANIGTLTLEASVAVGDSGKVYAIEPHPKLYKYLVGNIALNQFKNVITFDVAVGDKEGTISFSDRKQDDTQNRVVPEGGSAEDFISVKQLKLDDMPIEGEISLLKIDVEGYEKFVLKGAEKMLDRTKSVYFEWSEKGFSDYDYSTEEIIEMFQSKGFSLLQITKEGLEEFTTMELASGKNMVATKDPDLVRERYMCKTIDL